MRIRLLVDWADAKAGAGITVSDFIGEALIRQAKALQIPVPRDETATIDPKAETATLPPPIRRREG